jgi:hypothetical protein
VLIIIINNLSRIRQGKRKKLQQLRKKEYDSHSGLGRIRWILWLGRLWELLIDQEQRAGNRMTNSYS